MGLGRWADGAASRAIENQAVRAKRVTWFSALRASRRRVKCTKPWLFGYFWVKPKVTERDSSLCSEWQKTERKFRKWAQMGANNCVCHSECPLCHSERSEESRPEKEKRFFASLWMTGHGELRMTNYELRTPPFVIPNIERNLAPKKGRDSSLHSEWQGRGKAVNVGANTRFAPTRHTERCLLT